MTVLGLCHVCKAPTNLHCGLCGKPTCNKHLTPVRGMMVCPSCLPKFGKGEEEKRKFME